MLEFVAALQALIILGLLVKFVFVEPRRGEAGRGEWPRDR